MYYNEQLQYMLYTALLDSGYAPRIAYILDKDANSVAIPVIDVDTEITDHPITVYRYTEATNHAYTNQHGDFVSPFAPTRNELECLYSYFEKSQLTKDVFEAVRKYLARYYAGVYNV